MNIVYCGLSCEVRLWNISVISNLCEIFYGPKNGFRNAQCHYKMKLTIKRSAQRKMNANLNGG